MGSEVTIAIVGSVLIAALRFAFEGSSALVGSMIAPLWIAPLWIAPLWIALLADQRHGAPARPANHRIAVRLGIGILALTALAAGSVQVLSG